jgi:hypothetical protein
LKTIPAALATHFAGDTWTLATIWVITRLDSTVIRLTDHDTDLTVGGDTYTAAVGYVPSAIKHGVDSTADNMETAGILDDIGIKASELLGGLFDHATVDISLVNYVSPADGTIPLLKGRIGEVSLENGQFQAELRGLAQFLTRHIGRLITPGCDADLGDARCGVNMTSFTETGTVPGVWLIDAVRWTISDWPLNPSTVFSFEIEVRGSAGGADQASPASNASADSFQSGSYIPDNAFDDNVATSWRTSGGGSHWLQFDFDSAVAFSEYWMDGDPAGTANWIDWIVEVQLADSTDWILIDTVSGADWDSPPVDTVWVVEQAAGTSTGSRIQLLDPARTEADDHWKGGKITWTSGPNNGLSMDIKNSWASGRILFWEPMPFDIEVDDTYSVQTGCDKTLNTCINVYFNAEDNRGFPHLRGISELLRGPQ